MNVVLAAPACKGYPSWAPPLPLDDIGTQGWHVLQADWPLPCATIRQAALRQNVRWMQDLVTRAGVGLAPHGKTTLSPELFQMQLDAGAWGITFATAGQLALGVQAGVTRAILANQVLLPHDLQWLSQLFAQHTTLQAPFLLDSHAQLESIETWVAGSSHRSEDRVPAPFDVLVELGIPSGRTGCRSVDQALELAHAAHRSPSVRLVGIECYEGLWAKGDTEQDTRMVNTLMEQVHALAMACDQAGLFHDTREILITGGGSAVYDLVAKWLKPELSRPTKGLLRSGCYVTHDDGFYKRLGHLVNTRLGSQSFSRASCSAGLQAALEVWCVVQSRPEPHLAILNAGKRDLSCDMGMPVAVRWAPAGHTQPEVAPPTWHITQLNDQHAYLVMDAADDETPVLQVGDRVALGISHPCTTFDKWRWMPLVSDTGDIQGAISTHF